MNQLLLLIAAALMVGAAIYLGHQGFRLARANRALLGVVKEMDESRVFAVWQPVETAPKQTRVLTARQNMDGEWMFDLATYDRVGLATGWHLYGNLFANKVTHWAPIPAAPEP